MYPRETIPIFQKKNITKSEYYSMASFPISDLSPAHFPIILILIQLVSSSTFSNIEGIDQSCVQGVEDSWI
jgi:hypothetical protein